jgi:hypothetical protein
VIRPRSQEPGYLAPIVSFGVVGLAIWFCLMRGGAVQLRVLSRHGTVVFDVGPLVGIRVIAPQRARMTWRQAFEALP